VKAGDYNTVANALLWTLEKGLGPAFTPPTSSDSHALFTDSKGRCVTGGSGR